MDKKQINRQLKKFDTLSIEVNDIESYRHAAGMILSLMLLKGKINDYWKDPIEKAYATHKSLTGKRSELLAPVEQRINLLKTKVNMYLTDENKRLEAEVNKEKSRILNQAEKAKDKGNTEKYNDLVEKSEWVSYSSQKTMQIDGVGKVTKQSDISIEIVDEQKLIKTILDGNAPLRILKINESELKKYIKDFGIEQIDGVDIEKTVIGCYQRTKNEHEKD